MWGTLIDASIPSGFEKVCLEEVVEKIPGISETSHTRGHVRFRLPTEMPIHQQIQLLKSLRSVDNLYVVFGTKGVDFASKREMKSGLLPILEGLIDLNWQGAIHFWSEYTGFFSKCLQNVDGKQLLNAWDNLLEDLDKLVEKVELDKKHASDEGSEKKVAEKKVKPVHPTVDFSFRASSTRAGECHSFTSREVACEVGGLLHDGFGWYVNLTDYDMEVVVMIRDNLVSYCLSLTRQSLHRRNNAQRLGNMSLRSTIAYNMLRMCDIQVGDVVVDPMCGSGAVLVESMLSEYGKSAFHIAGDICEPVVTAKAWPSLQAVTCDKNAITRGADCMVFNSVNLPFRTASVDVIIADMPFGKRCGNRQINSWLYPAVLKEFARVLVPKGRACILTGDQKNMNKAITQRIKLAEEKTSALDTGEESAGIYPSHWIKPFRSFTIHHGGLNPLVYLFRRSTLAFL